MLRSDWGLKGFGDSLWSDNTVLGFVGAEPDAELLAGLAKANRVQEFWLASCERCAARGCTGPEWVEDIRQRMATVNWTMGTEDCGSHGEPRCDGAIFSHPIGDFMHSTGPYIESSGGVYGRRRRGLRTMRGKAPPPLPSSDWRALKVRSNTWFSMELAAYGPWGESWVLPACAYFHVCRLSSTWSSRCV
uniref:Uncharacterized protein n=2 Tax=Alexandrium monilatum TaxID=311494 RepID=A0A7S4SXD3_9DINO